MVNVPGRSKGCVTCRRRKIKCDASLPACSQCLRMGLYCPGARTGAFFVHALPDSTSSKPIARQISTNLKGPTFAGAVQGWSCDRYWDPRLPSYQQPCRADLFDQLFVSHFIESFGFKASRANDPSSIWLNKLAVFITQPSPTLVRSSIRAGSMFFYGSPVDDVSIRTEANKWYLRALHGLRCLLEQQAGAFTGDIICSVVMLAHFETTAGTSGEAWFQHVQGAAQMLQPGGPASCRDGFLHQLFRHLRLLVFTAALFKNQQHYFSSQEWLTIPFETHSKTAFDEFVDILLSLLPCLGVAREMIDLRGERASCLKTKLDKLLRESISQLHSWWTKCTLSTNFIEANSEQWTGTSTSGFEDLPGDSEHYPLIPYSDMPSASLSALYDAVNVIVLRLAFLISSSAHLYETRIQLHVKSILLAKEFVATFPGPASSRGSVMVGLPLKIISIWSPSNMLLNAMNPLPGLDSQYEDRGTSSNPSRELFGEVAHHVLQLYSPEVFT
ncbi:hypothetical protein PMG11_02691 [Penicillium brasilianum]|uniref:Zn(2)-C6 fungal-type domain-containing protein n=1 Tax=Penicillium brasilianum TaxID=104259 RepID=A0A0F7TKT9_PENBI|nr:hypothetical protein PMG11_02691 [Penicillium brasilianum]